MADFSPQNPQIKFNTRVESAKWLEESECAANFMSDAVLKLSLSGRRSLRVKEEKYDEYNRVLADTIKTKTYCTQEEFEV